MSAEQHVPNKRQRELLDKHLELVIEENKVTNLTRIVDWESAQILHVEDSLAGLPEVEGALEGPYLDMGSGAGFPGIPLAIMTGRETLLADSVGKKTRALDSFAAELGIDDIVSTYHGRIEDLALQQPNHFSLVTARALSSLASLLELASPLLAKGGRLVCYKTTVNQRNLSMLGKLLANWEWNSFLREDSRFPMERQVEPSSYSESDVILR